MKYLFLLGLFLLTGFISSERVESIYLFWSPDVKLKWTDFHGHISPEDDIAASASYIGFFHKVRKHPHPDSVMLDTRAFFNKSKSWVKVPAVNPSLLEHEQRHFDLAELFARKFRKASFELKLRSQNLAKSIDSTYKYYSVRGDSIHIQYDIETNHGLSLIPQAKWNEKIKNGLLELSPYSNPVLKLFMAR